MCRGPGLLAQSPGRCVIGAANLVVQHWVRLVHALRPLSGETSEDHEHIRAWLLEKRSGADGRERVTNLAVMYKRRVEFDVSLRALQ